VTITMPTTTDTKLALPTPSQLAWADAEIGVIIHFDLQVFEASYEFRKRWGDSPDPKIFNPRDLDTDQWIRTAKSAGATYAVLVAKHCSGFSLWPTKAHDYSVASSPWRNGQGDIVGDFVASCHKYGLKPGLYCSASCNGYLRADNPGKVVIDDPEYLKKYSRSTEMQSKVGREGGGIWAGPEAQAAYNQAVETQLAELWSNYGKLFEIWFDGGVIDYENGGPNIIPLLYQHQPDAVVLAGPTGWPSLIRTIGNELGEAPDPCWNTTSDRHTEDDGTIDAPRPGTPDGELWVPGEADMPNRGQHSFQGGWFWREGDDPTVFSLNHLVERYFTSVARNCNLLLGMVINPRGLVPELDRQRFAEFGERISQIFSAPIAKTQGTGTELILKLPAGRTPTILELAEDIRHGERVRKFTVEAKTPGGWLEIWRGSCIGHKRIERFEPIQASELRLRILESAADPLLRNFAAWEADADLFSVPMNVTRRTKPMIHRGQDGLVSIDCVTPHLSSGYPVPNLAVRYTCDGSEPDASSPLYTAPFPLLNGGVVKAYAYVNELSHSETATAFFGVDRRDWKVVSVSLESPFQNNGYANVAHLLNDDPEYYWHTYHTDKSKSAAPHEVVLDMGRTHDVAAFTFAPRSTHGTPDQVEFYLSQDGKNWTLAAASRVENLHKDSGIRRIQLESPMSGRFLRFVAKHVLDDVDYVVVAGLGIMET
jgi:alpha-L-fucosidase